MWISRAKFDRLVNEHRNAFERAREAEKRTEALKFALRVIARDIGDVANGEVKATQWEPDGTVVAVRVTKGPR